MADLAMNETAPTPLEVELGPYERFVIYQLADAYEMSFGKVIEMMLLGWITANPALMMDARASIGVFKQKRGDFVRSTDRLDRHDDPVPQRRTLDAEGVADD